MGDGKGSDGIPEVVRRWLAVDRDGAGTEERLRILEDLVAYWVPVSIERDLRIETLEARLENLEAGEVGAAFPCVVDLTERVGVLEQTIWKLGRRLGIAS